MIPIKESLMKKCLSLMVILCLTVCFVLGCQKKSPYPSTLYEGDSFEFQYVDGWEQVNNTKVTAAFCKSAGLTTFKDNFTIVVQPLNGYSIQLDEFKDITVKEYNKQEGMHCTNVEKTKLSGYDGYLVEVSIDTGVGESIGFQKFTFANHNLYILTFLCDQAAYLELKEEVLFMMDSFKIK